MALDPKFVVLDEPTSALDMSIQAQIVDLLRDLQKRRKLAYLFISHDLKVVRALASEIIVMRRGKVVESGEAKAVFAAPQNDYTRALFAAAFANEATPTRRRQPVSRAPPSRPEERRRRRCVWSLPRAGWGGSARSAGWGEAR